MEVSKYKYRLLILALGIVSTVSALGAGLTDNLLFYNGFTSSRYLSESVFSWRVIDILPPPNGVPFWWGHSAVLGKKVPLILIGGLLINLTAVVLNMHQLAFISSATFALNSIVISWKVLGDKVRK